MSSMPPLPQRRIALLIDCDNAAPDAVAFALERIRTFGKVVARRGYGGQSLLGPRWKETMLRLAITPHLHYSAVSGKNTSDLALALDAFELATNGLVDMLCLVTSDADFVYLCTKLRERGVASCVVGEPKTPHALRAAGDSFHEFVALDSPLPQMVEKAARVPSRVHDANKLLTSAVSTMLTETGLARIPLPKFGQFLRERHPGFSCKQHQHATLKKMLATVPMLECRWEGEMHTVALRISHDRCPVVALSG